MVEKTRVGVIGVGYLGQIHAKIYHQMDNVELVMLADTCAETAAALADKYHCDHTTNHMDMLDRVDAVSIVVPTSYHHDVAQPFLEAGIATLIEKPIAATVDEARNMVELAAQNVKATG